MTPSKKLKVTTFGLRSLYDCNSANMTEKLRFSYQFANKITCSDM